MIRFTLMLVAAVALSLWIPKAQAEYIDVEALAKRLSTPSVWVKGHWSGGHWVNAHQRGTSWVWGPLAQGVLGEGSLEKETRKIKGRRMAVKRKAKVEIPTTPMKVKFYVAYQLSEDKKPIPEIVDWPSLLKEIEKLPFSLPSGSDTRYDKADDGEYAVWPEKVTWPCEIVAARIRRSNLPRKEAKGKVDPLPLLPAEGVMEGTHAVFFEDGGVAIRHNHGSMSASRLSYYFGQRVGRRIFLEPILDMSAMQRIKESGKIHELTLHWPGGMPPLKADNPLASMLKVLKGAPNQLKVSISIDPASESSWFKKLFKWANDTRKVAEEVDPADLGRSKPGVRAEIRHDGTKPNEVVDLLSDQLVTTVDVARVNTIERAVDKKDAFSKLKTAYKEKSKLTKLFLKTFFE